MAEKIKPPRKGQRKSREEGYPWDQWFDGEQYRLSVGTANGAKTYDINAKSPKNATITVRKAVKRRKGLKVVVQLDGPKHILVQAKISPKQKKK